MTTYIITINLEQTQAIVKEVVAEKKISGHEVVMDILSEFTTAQRRDISRGMSIILSGNRALSFEKNWL